MAKFKIGDRVKIELWNKPTVHGKLLKYENGVATIEQDGAGKVTYEVDEDGITPLNSVHSSNAVVQKALNACKNATARNGYVVLRTASGGTARVYEGDRVAYAGKEYVAKALGSPSLQLATLVDGSGNKLVVRLKDVDLKALDARTARNGNVEDKYRVTLDTLTLDGKGKTSKVVTAAKLKQILTFLRQPQAFDTMLDQVAKHGSTDMAAEMPLNLVVEKA